MGPTVVFVLLVSVWLLVCWLICLASARQERRRMRERLGQELKSPQMVKHPERPADVPEFCPICTRPMGRPIATAEVVTILGAKSTIYCCSFCLVLGGLDSAMSAASENSVPPSCTELAQPCGSYPDPRALSDLPGGGSPAAGTF